MKIHFSVKNGRTEEDLTLSVWRQIKVQKIEARTILDTRRGFSNEFAVFNRNSCAMWDSVIVTNHNMIANWSKCQAIGWMGMKWRWGDCVKAEWVWGNSRAKIFADFYVLNANSTDKWVTGVEGKRLLVIKRKLFLKKSGKISRWQ